MRQFLAAGLTIFAVLAAPAAAADKKPVDPNKKVCRRDSSGTGSILPRTVCRTSAEWKYIDEANHAEAERHLSAPGASTPSLK